MSKSEEKPKINYFILIFRIISIIIIVICLYVIYLWHLDNQKNNSLKDSLSDFIVTNRDDSNLEESFSPVYTETVDNDGLSIEQFTIDYDSLLKKNEDCIGWIRILDTNISYPIVQAKDNDFYLTHNIEKAKNGAGWIFADYRNNFDFLDKNTIVYGHNRRNGTMFSNLQFYLDEDFCSNPNHKYINLNIKNDRYLAEVFSAYKISSNKVELPNSFTTITEFEETLNEWKNNSVYNFNVDVKASDSILSLYTCDDSTSYRILVHAKLIALK